MSSEQTPATMPEMLESVLDNWKKGLYTATPGIIQSYDAATKQADIQPALRRSLQDGTFEELPILPNVPVLFPSGGGYAFHVELEAGDAVQVLFCQRGIGQFKKSFGLENPTGGVLQMDSPVAIAGFGGLSITPVGKISMQSEDGERAVYIDDDSVEVKVGDDVGITIGPDTILAKANTAIAIEVLLNTSEIEVTVGALGGFFVLFDGSIQFKNGISFTTTGSIVLPPGADLITTPVPSYIAHVHGGVDTGSGDTQGPE